MASPLSLPTVPTATIGGLPIAALDRVDTARLMLKLAAAHPEDAPPLYMTSANGQVLSEAARRPELRRLFEAADLISADGQPMVLWSKVAARVAIPERCATTDLYHDVSRQAAPGTRYYLLGSTAQEVERAVETTRRLYPHITIAGYRDGYFTPAEEPAVAAAVAATRPDILWIAMGVPREQEFICRRRRELAGVRLVKTSGGLFNFLSGTRSRAPGLMQAAGLEWLYRMMLEPRRLFWRYLVTNLHSGFLLLTRTR
jgi:exopolysaccharide biosynthesis WecB/TagA/CpsF family protein